MLDAVHVYDPNADIRYMGSGERRGVTPAPGIITTLTDTTSAGIGVSRVLTVAALPALRLSQLPTELVPLLRSAAVLVCGYLGMYLMLMRRAEFLDILSGLNPAHLGHAPVVEAEKEPVAE